MASAFVPPPPEDDLLDPILLSSQQKDASYGGSLGYSERTAGQEKTYSFGGDGFLNTTGQLYIFDGSSGGHAAAGHTGGREALQRVPETPALTGTHRRTPMTEDCRLNFSFDTPSVPSGRGHIGLRPVSEIPERYRSVFSGFTHFNLVQSKVFDDVMYTDLPLVASAPTGSGKTVIFELAIIRLMMQMGEQVSSAKIVYVAPMKALCSERYEDWQAKFSPLGLRCCELTGDSQLDDYFELQNAQIVMTTPEKWDSMTRKWRDHKSLVQLVRLFLIDEVHQLNDEARGPTMEAIVSRMKTVRASLSWEEGGRGPANQKQGSEVLRFIAISATIPNITDVASWLGSEELPALEYSIDESHRPVRLRRVVLSYPNASSEFKFDLSLNYRLSNVIHCYSDQKPTLVFCATRKGTQQAASTLVKDARFVMNSEHKQRLQRAASSLRDSKLRDLVVYGVGYHHAGMEIADRKVIEGMFTSGDLPVLFSTSTLAMGVNLPAHLVVVKSTLHYVGGMFQEYSESQILQMIGRAGRPQFDTTATAVIMTRHSTKVRYEALLGGTQLIESSLHRNLIEHLNAEIVLHTITDVSIALEWLKSTFLFIRIKQNPRHYGIPEDQVKMEEKLQELCLKDLNLLEANSLIKMEDGFILQPTDTGRLMARYCVAFESMKRFLTLKGHEGLAELVGVVSQCKEFEDVHLRANEKRVLNTLNKDKNRLTIRFPMSGRIKTTDMKVNCLIQATLGCLPIQEFALNQDSQKIFRAASRLVRCLMELQLLGDNFSLQLSATLMHKCIQARLWETSKHVAKQLEKIGVTLSTTLVNAGLTTFEKLQETNPRELELIMNRHPPFGNQIRDAVAKLPRYAISLEQSSSLSVQQAELTVSVQLVNHALLKETGSTAGPSHICILLIGDADNHVLMKQKIFDSQMLASGRFSRRLTVKRASSSPELRLHLISLEYVGIDVQEVYTPRYSRPPTLTAPQATMAGARRGKPCAHRCINKAICGHTCCRNGLTETANDEFQSHSPAPPTPRPHPNPTPTRASAAQRKAPPPRKRTQGAMGNFLSELHTRSSCIPETPALKRLKPSLSSSHPVSSSRGSEYSPSLSERFSYTPSAKKMSPPTRSRPMRSKLSDSHNTHGSSFNTSCMANSSTSSFSSSPREEATTTYLSSVPPPPPTASYDDYGDFDFQDDDVFEFHSDPDSDTDLPTFTMDTSYTKSSTATKSTQPITTRQYQNSRFSPSLKTGTPKWMTISSSRHEIDRTQKPGSMPPPAAIGLKRPLDDSFGDSPGPLPDYQTYRSTASSLPRSSTPKKSGYSGVPLPRSSLSTPAGSQQVPLSKKLSSQMQRIDSSVFANQTRPTVAKTRDNKEPPFSFIPKLVKTTGSYPVRTVTATPTREPPPPALASVAAFDRPSSLGTGGACSFFTTGPVSRDDGDLFDSVFAGIF